MSPCARATSLGTRTRARTTRSPAAFPALSTPWQLLALQPSHALVEAAHPTAVKMPPRRRVRRQHTPRSDVDNTVLCEIEAEISRAAAEA